MNPRAGLHGVEKKTLVFTGSRILHRPLHILSITLEYEILSATKYSIDKQQNVKLGNDDKVYFLGTRNITPFACP